VSSVVVRLPSLMILEEAASILEALPDGLLVTDVLGRITFANERMERISGYTGEELLGMPVDLLVPERLRTIHERQRGRFSAEPRIRPMGTGLDTRLLRRDGSELSVQIQLSPAEIGDKRGVLVAIRDVGERTQAELLHREHEDALVLLADRELMAREVNAGVIHTLFGIGLHLQGAVENATEDGARKAMEQAVAQIDQAITEVRQHIFRHGSDTAQSSSERGAKEN
jgi:PAS domain S-box-containing protein